MLSIRQQLQQIFTATIKEIHGVDTDPMLQPAGRPEYGDYQANFALRLAKTLQKKPFDIANAVITKLQASPLFAKLEASGPGFINITLKDTALENQLQKLMTQEHLGLIKTPHPDTVVVDYSSANVAKEMHVGHLRTTIIGDAIARILNFLGHQVIRQNHIGDWGTQFGMLIEHLIESHWQVHQTADLTTLYQQAKKRFDEDKIFAERARARVVALQEGDKKSREIWQQLVKHSLQYFQSIYQKLDVLLVEKDVCGESFYNDKLNALVTELQQKNIAAVDQGAVVIFLKDFFDPDGNPLPMLIRKSDGGYLYATTDLAAIRYRIQELKANRLIYVVDARQKQHFDMLFAAAQVAGWADNTIRLEHVEYGTVLGEDHKPFKTRSGDTIKLNELLAEAEKRAAALILQKHPEIAAEELAQLANRVGIGALKYADLRNDKAKDYVFSWDRMLAFDGNTGPYLQNAYVRIAAIFRKSPVDVQALDAVSLHISSPIEHILAVKIAEFPDVVSAIANHLHLHYLCDYLYDLAGLFHKFYEHCPVLTVSDTRVRDSRLQWCVLTARTLKLGLNLLGIQVLERM
ncbi:hypothetical protein AYO45_03045 [Gammaproteobacteria bacterium SCGC AG-212-F23]|nr:hypothetical protein AYO45_03045 [Gammaproteobacteria bacterium SCGC AG-212-F23]